jgi:hypothetical protein
MWAIGLPIVAFDTILLHHTQVKIQCIHAVTADKINIQIGDVHTVLLYISFLKQTCSKSKENVINRNIGNQSETG